MNILVDTRHLAAVHQSGVGAYTKAVLHALFSIDQDNTYELLTSGRTIPSLPFNQYTHVTHTHSTLPNKWLTTRMVLSQSPTLTSLATVQPDLLFLPNLAITPPINTPYVLTIHDLSWKLHPAWYSAKMRLWHRLTNPKRLIQHASGLIVPSESAKRDLIRLFHSPAPIRVIPHGVDSAFVPKMPPHDHGTRSRLRLPKRFALFVGTLTQRKNILAIIEGMNRYRSRTGDNLCLVLAGAWGWNNNEIKRELANTNYHWVRHLGYVSESDKPALYRAAQVLVWPSLYEGFGLPVLEAMASGTPVITSCSSSLPELAGDAAILVAPGRPTDVSLALEQLMSSQTLQQTLIERGITRAASFTWHNSATHTHEFMRELMTSKK